MTYPQDDEVTRPEELGITPDQLDALAQALADREAEANTSQLAPYDEEGVQLDEPSPLERVSSRAIDLIIRHETGGPAYYRTVIKERPEWPKGSSGITIGFGYDLGYVTAAEFARDWAALPQAARAALASAVGKHGANSTPAAMKLLRDSLRNAAVISWPLADSVFRATTLPRFSALTARALPNWTFLPSDCFGALVSLTFNRGASYGREGARYTEMRAIKAAMMQRRFREIAAHIRAMRRIWIGTAIEAEMLRRRENEAALFESGLAFLAAGPAVRSGPSADEEDGTGDEAPGWIELTEEDLVTSALQDEPLFEEARSTTRPSWADDNRAPDYAHLRTPPVEAAFTLEPADLQLLVDLNDFAVDGYDTPILFGLRGCAVVRAAGPLTLKDQRPDHITPRCTMGVWDRRQGRIFVFPGSTVPDRRAVLRWKQTRKSGNLLATGFYGYIVGPHATVGASGKLNSRPGCFLLRENMDRKREVIVRRSNEDLSYELDDMHERGRPGDNIHPTFFTQPTDFSSFGCQTVVGFADSGGNHRGPWAEFRRAAGLVDEDGEPGKRYGYMLLTGTEARLASDLRRRGLATDPQSLRTLRRLRFGSRSSAVTRLQIGLKLPDPDQSFGPNTAAALYALQKSLSPKGEADGIYTPWADAALGFGVFSGLGT